MEALMCKVRQSAWGLLTLARAYVSDDTVMAYGVAWDDDGMGYFCDGTEHKLCFVFSSPNLGRSFGQEFTYPGEGSGPRLGQGVLREEACDYETQPFCTGFLLCTQVDFCRACADHHYINMMTAKSEEMAQPGRGWSDIPQPLSRVVSMYCRLEVPREVPIPRCPESNGTKCC